MAGHADPEANKATTQTSGELMSFQEATRSNIKLRVAIAGPSGTGKTWSAILLAKELTRLLGLPEDKLGLMDSERDSARKYAKAPNKSESPGNWRFLHDNVEEKNLQSYQAKVKEAAEFGVNPLIVDSFSHAWIGALETVDKMGGSKFSNGWKVVSPMERALIDQILSYPGHVIATMRSKSEYAIEQVNGKAVPKKIGMAPVAREGTEFEFDVFFELDTQGGLSVSKTRCPALSGQIFTREDIPKVAKILADWIAEGAPASARDVWADKIRFCQSSEDLRALIPGMKELPAEDRKALQDIFLKRKAEFAATETPATP